MGRFSEYVNEGARGGILDSWRIAAMMIVGLIALIVGLVAGDTSSVIGGALGLGLPILLFVVDFALFSRGRRGGFRDADR